MKFLIPIALFFGTISSVFGQDKYSFYMDLNKISNDLIEVTLETPAIKESKIIYNMPKIVPVRIKFTISDNM